MKKFLLILSFLSLTSVLYAEKKPNILIIMADDLGFSDLSCYGGEIQTPVLDSLAFNGLRYTQFYNTARCWPTRSAIMSGYYPQQIGRDKVLDLEGGGRGIRPEWAPLIPIYLKKSGYKNYHSGKWHIDGKQLANGFDHAYELKDQHRFFNPTKHSENDQPLPPIQKNTGFYGTTEVTDKIIHYLKGHQKNHQNQPFFAYLAYAAPHFPLHALPEDIKKVGERYKDGWDVIRKQRQKNIKKLGILNTKLSDVLPEVGPPYHFPESLEMLGPNEVNQSVPWNTLTPGQKKFQQDKMTLHAAMIERMDLEIGRVIQQIKNMKQYKDTLIVFLSDNGASAEIMVRGDGHNPEAKPGSAESHLCLGPGWSTVANTPFKKHKTWNHEGGISTPFIAHWPNGIEAKGELRKHVAHVIDILPTILDITQTTTSHKIPLPGKSIKSSFDDNSTKERTLWFAHDNHHAIRKGDWKLVKSFGQKWELYNLSEDRSETSNLASKFPEKVQSLEKAWNDKVTYFKSHAPKPLPKKKKKTK